MKKPVEYATAAAHALIDHDDKDAMAHELSHITDDSDQLIAVSTFLFGVGVLQMQRDGADTIPKLGVEDAIYTAEDVEDKELDLITNVCAIYNCVVQSPPDMEGANMLWGTLELQQKAWLLGTSCFMFAASVKGEEIGRVSDV